MTPRHLAWYITAHGYGHGVRSCDILSALHRLAPHIRITVCTNLDEVFLASRMHGVPFTRRPVTLDSGMVQIDSVRVDLPASYDRIAAIVADWDAKTASEKQWMQAAGVDMVVADIPAIPFEAAAGLGIPSLGISNFTWSWIYGEFVEHDPRWAPIIARFEQAYRMADGLLRLPFSEPMSIFSRQTSVGVVARPGVSQRHRIAEKCAVDPQKTWVLLSFSDLEWSDAALERLREYHDAHEFFTLLPLHWKRPWIHAIDRREFRVPDVFASVDAVLSKPGFGVLSDCVANDKPLIHVEREHFREYPVLVEAIQKHLRHVFLPAERLYRADLGDALNALPRLMPAPHPLTLGGDDDCARHILRTIS